MGKKTYYCTICNVPFVKYECQVNTDTPVCSQNCKSQLFKIKLRGKNNSNYGNKWSKKQKSAQSKLVKSKINEEYRYKSGSANRGKKFSVERILKMHRHRDSISYSHPHTNETKKIIGEKSRKKFTNEYKKRHREVCEKKGYWLPLNEIDEYKLYSKWANWCEKMFDNVDDVTLLKQYGVFNTRTNKTGVVRDHIYSRRTGFKFGVFPELLRHPCNCKLLTHSDNVKKKNGRYTDADGKTLEELFKDIESYKKEWKEQNLCLQLITDYKNGLRYNKQDYIKKYYEYNN